MNLRLHPKDGGVIKEPCSLNQIFSNTSLEMSAFKVGDKVEWTEYDPQGAAYGMGVSTVRGEVTEVIQMKPSYKVKPDYGGSYVVKPQSNLSLQAGGSRRKTRRRSHRQSHRRSRRQ